MPKSHQGECIQCGSPSPFEYGFCSPECRYNHHFVSTGSPNTPYNQVAKHILRKLELVRMMGGSCNKCGYNDNLASLAFHHIDPLTKSFNLGSRNLGNRSWKVIMEEASKCELLCHNCHSAHHFPLSDIKLIHERLISLGVDPDDGKFFKLPNIQLNTLSTSLVIRQ